MKEVLRYEDLLRIEKNLIKPVLESINKALKSIYENKSVKLLGSDFDKHIYFYVDKDFKTAKWDINEDKVRISDIKDIELEVNSMNKAFEKTIVEAIDLISAEKLSEAEDKFGEALQWKLKEKTADKLSVFNKRPIIKEARTKLVKIGKIVLEQKQDKEVEQDGGSSKKPLKQLIEQLERLTEKFLGREVKTEEAFEVSLTEGKVVHVQKPIERTPTLVRNIEIAKSEAQKLDIKPILENTQTFISDHEELFLLKSDVIKTKIEEVTKKDISVTKGKVTEIMETFNKMRNESESFKTLVKQILKEEGPSTDGANEEPTTDKDLDGDAAVDTLNQKVEDDKLAFMKQFVDILSEIFEKIREVGQDDGELLKRVDNALNIIRRNKEEGKWDKEELADIAREAIELAAKVEGIEPEDTEISKRAQEERDDKEAEKETISGKTIKAEMYPASQQPAQEISGNYNYSGALREGQRGPGGVGKEFDYTAFNKELDRVEKSLMSPDYTPTDRDFQIVGIAKKLVDNEPMNVDEIAILTGMSKGGIEHILQGALRKMKTQIETNPEYAELNPKYEAKNEEGVDDVTISPEGDITFAPEDFEDIGGGMDTFVCQSCEREFNAETGETEYHCPYCGEVVSGEMAPVEETGPAADQPGQEVAGNTAYKAEKKLKSEVAIGAIQPQEVNEKKEKVVKEDIEDKMKAQDKRGLILGKGEEEEQEEAKIGPQDFAGKEEVALPPTVTPTPPSATPTKATMPTSSTPPTATSSIPTAEEEEQEVEEKKICECGECEECMAAVQACNEEEFERIALDEAELGTLPAGTDVLATYRSKSDPTKRYYIIRARDGSHYCTCPAWKFQHLPPSQRTCKHLDDYHASQAAMVREQTEEEFERCEITEQEKASFPPGSDILATYRSKSNPDKRYYIVKGKDGVTYCTCPSWKFQSGCAPEERTCKHLTDFKGAQGDMIKEEKKIVKESKTKVIKKEVKKKK